MRTIDDLLMHVVKAGASDLHLKVGSPPIIRVDGELTEAGPDRLHPRRHQGLRRLAHERQADPAFQRDQRDRLRLQRCPRWARFRVNVYRQRGTISIALRQVVARVPDFDELNLPPVVQKLALEPRGMVLVTGTTGSGKTTTLAAMIDHINQQLPQAHRDDRGSHRDPASRPQVHHQPARGGARHRELQHRAQVRARQDPDIIFIGEMRDQETVRTALTAAQTGHFVLSTLHTIDVDRDCQPHHRLLPALSAEAGAHHAGRDSCAASSPSACWCAPTARAACPPSRSW